MTRKSGVILLLSAAALVSLLLPVGGALSQQLQSVLIANFPEIQRVEGTVEVAEPIPQTRFFSRGEILVPQVDLENYTQLISGGTLDVAGFSWVDLSLAGEIKGRVTSPATVGALLIPDVEPVNDAFEEEGLFELSLRVTAATRPGSSFFASDPQRLPLSFPRYRVFFFNTGDRTAGIHLFASASQG